MLGNWLVGFTKDLRSLVLLGATTTIWSLCLCQNYLVFRTKITLTSLQVIFSTIHWLHLWVVLYKQELRSATMEAMLQLEQVAKAFFLDEWVEF